MKEEKKYHNRELSWLEFNYRVLEEALDKSNPLLERLKFLSIFSSNLDEFFMVRLSGLLSQLKPEYASLKLPSGDTALEIVTRLKSRINELVKQQYDCFNTDILPNLEKEGFQFYTAQTLPEKYIPALKELFSTKYSLMLTPMAIDPSHPFPFITGKTLNLLVRLFSDKQPDLPLYAIIPIPTATPRFLRLDSGDGKATFIYFEEAVKLFSSQLFVGYNIDKTCLFRITRDAEIAVDEEDSNLLTAIEMGLKLRERGFPIRLEVEKDADEDLLLFLQRNNMFCEGFDFKIDGPLDLTDFMEIACIDGYLNLKSESFPPIVNRAFQDSKMSIFDIIRNQDHLLFLPFESFDPVIRFISEAASDKKVLAIKMTLYRTSGDSPIIRALKKAAENGKQVTVVVELKARFDEARNITWAKQLEQAGCHVIYGVVGLKTHGKIALIVRDEEDGINRYVHLATGNYNDKTAKIYTDIGLFTAKKKFGSDASAIFNLLTGYSEPPRWKKLVTAPLDLRSFFLEKIKREAQNARSGGKGQIIAKMNALIDTKVIDALYEASCAGVEIILIVRGMCRLKAGIPGLSENITVRSIVDVFLEHSRIFWFHNQGNDELFLASADWMERNLDKRVEILFPVDDPKLVDEVKKVLEIILNDNKKTRLLQPNGTYKHIQMQKNEAEHRSQLELYDFFKKRNTADTGKQQIRFVPNTKPD